VHCLVYDEATIVPTPEDYKGVLTSLYGPQNLHRTTSKPVEPLFG
jgi:hypothetical protein